MGWLSEDQIVLLRGATKQEVIRELVGILAPRISPRGAPGLEEAVFHRERLSSTAIGHAIGVPHVRWPGVSKPFLVLGLKAEGVTDYACPDGGCVKFVVLIVAGTQEHRAYLALLEELTKTLESEAVREKALQAETPQQVMRALGEACRTG